MASDEYEWVDEGRPEARPAHWTRPKLTAQQRDDIRQRVTDGESPAVLAAEYGVSVATIRNHS